MKYSNIKSMSVSRGFAKPNFYSVEFAGAPLPEVDKLGIQVTGDDGLGLYAEQCELPGRNINTQDKGSWKSPYGDLYDITTMSFYLGAGLKEKMFFDLWMAYIVDPQRKKVEYHNNYVRDIQINVLDNDGAVMYGLKLLEAFPVSMAPVALSYASANQVATASVTFAFKRWEATGAKLGKKKTGQKPFRDVTEGRGTIAGDVLNDVRDGFSTVSSQLKRSFVDSLETRMKSVVTDLPDLDKLADNFNFYNPLGVVKYPSYDKVINQFTQGQYNVKSLLANAPLGFDLF